ncbi:MAG TPA: bifunctional 4-hydroxy-2-oxoglutarate aldolase/2-dehydro-3-deoxy-phosphogluconate aldolase [Actinobacteria bacterium]|nr:2-dehydro-3-deoxy-6-phosphogalactonate aldolase [bacterium BMS3Bbin01]HDH27480.1 bifunctional 4-hydroxy-2-oxoglutarate aldolase/2-dehydro-3-deoxy-phosphogluconate aldolase [Actinomycetota bacterium]
MNRLMLPSAVTRSRLIAVLRGLDPGRVGEVVGVLRRAGVAAFEITMDSPDAVTSIQESVAGGVVAGAGTVMTVADAEAAVDAGARFLVSPHTNLTVVHWAAGNGVPMVPGAFTATEVAVAWNAGAGAIKIFPASVGGPGLLRALRGPFGDLPLIPTGGITADNAASFLAAGALAVGVGGWLTKHDDLNVVAERAAAIVDACRS